MSSFERASEIEKQSLLDLIPWLESFEQGSQIVMTSNHEYLQRIYGDVIARLRRYGTKIIELKAEQSFTGNMFIELWSNFSNNKQGWAITSRADWLWYYFVDVGQLFTVEMSDIQRWTNEAKHHWRLRKQHKYAQGNDTFGIVVPIDELRNQLASFRGPFFPRQNLADGG